MRVVAGASIKVDVRSELEVSQGLYGLLYQVLGGPIHDGRLHTPVVVPRLMARHLRTVTHQRVKLHLKVLERNYTIN